MTTMANVERTCCELVGLRYRLEIVDVLADPLRALNDDVLMTPTLVRLVPTPHSKIIGNLTEGQKLLELMRPVEVCKVF